MGKLFKSWIKNSYDLAFVANIKNNDIATIAKADIRRFTNIDENTSVLQTCNWRWGITFWYSICECGHPLVLVVLNRAITFALHMTSV